MVGESTRCGASARSRVERALAPILIVAKEWLPRTSLRRSARGACHTTQEFGYWARCPDQADILCEIGDEAANAAPNVQMTVLHLKRVVKFA